MKRRSLKRKTLRNTRKKGGVKNPVDIFYDSLELLPARLMNKRGESTDDVIHKLKMTVTPDSVEIGIKKIIEEMNSSHHFPEKFSCWQVRETYEKLIHAFINHWVQIIDEINSTNKAKGIGASYLRWVLRVATRRFTNTKMVTRYNCDPADLERRDEKLYHCQPNQQCPSDEYVIQKYKLPVDDETSPQWNVLVNAGLKHNARVDSLAALGKYLDI